MHASPQSDELQRVLRYWWMLELFNPQQIPKSSSSASGATKRVTTWGPGTPLPWEVLPPPPPSEKTKRVWSHTIYLGVYDVAATYDRLHQVFGEDPEVYNERSSGKSACACVRIDSDGKLLNGSAVLSSALWAVGQIDKGNVHTHSWAEEFPKAARDFVESIDSFAQERSAQSGNDGHLTVHPDTLVELLNASHAASGVAGNPSLATQKIVIQSVAISAERPDDQDSPDFLNSFFLEDLETIRSSATNGGQIGDALVTYLTGDSRVNTDARIDVIQRPDAVEEGVRVGRMPKGRWLSNPEHALSLRQQFAVNRALTDLAPRSGLMGVNGPPGTGKTTMLRDILAGNIVERARRLARIKRPQDAFTHHTHTWTAVDGRPRRVRQLQPELLGFEMIVTSANNAAVENVTEEIPSLDAIDRRWRGEADYFADIASATLAKSRERGAPDVGAWGLIAARLGNKSNRSAFRSAFWFDETKPHSKERLEGTAPRMQSRLAEWQKNRGNRRSWEEGCAAFAAAERRVDSLMEERRCAESHLRNLPRAVERVEECAALIDRIQHEIANAEESLITERARLKRSEQHRDNAITARARHIHVKPGLFETLFSLGRSIREWREELRPFDDDVRVAEAHYREASARANGMEQQKSELTKNLMAAKTELARGSDSLSELRLAVAADKERLGVACPSDAQSDAAREMRAPWLDPELDAARSDLFLAAMDLHQDFIANAARDMTEGLRAALEVLDGSCPHDLEPEKKLAAWQLFFLVVPLISTTFASVGRMFAGLAAESFGWVFIDEAGQASPQHAVSAIWRAKRVVVVGDPLQLQPVVTVPQKVRRDIAAAYEISETWIPPQASAQTLADRVSKYGTFLQQGEDPSWVSTPLTVHRRCDEPMFSLCNEIAYNGIMVNGVHRNLSDPGKPDRFDAMDHPKIFPSSWLDEPALTKGTHLQENQIERFERGLKYLSDVGVQPRDVIAVSPFRAVADRLGSLTRAYPGLTAGTIHTAQGKQAAVVFLVLGGDPSSRGAKEWAASAVNLVNVAASRAVRRLYVIGDRATWSQHNYFNQLSAFLTRH